MFMRKTTEIPIAMIRTNSQQPRQVFAQEQLMELRDSIKEFGVLQPLILGAEWGVFAHSRRTAAQGGDDGRIG